MTGPKTRAAISSGVIPHAAVKQFHKWRSFDEEVLETEGSAQTMEEIVDTFRYSLESDDALEIRDTDLDAATRHERTKERGRLYIPTKDGPSYLEINFSRTKAGEYMLPWRDDRTRDLLLDERTYIKPTGQAPVYIADVRDLYYGDKRVFMICTPATEVIP